MLNLMDKLFTAWKSYFIVIFSPERLHQSDFDACARLMSNYLIISFLHLGSHYLFSVRSKQDKGRKVRQVKSVMRHCSRFHPLCISVKDQVRFMYHNITPLLGNQISKHHYRFHFVKID